MGMRTLADERTHKRARKTPQGETARQKNQTEIERNTQLNGTGIKRKRLRISLSEKTLCAMDELKRQLTRYGQGSLSERNRLHLTLFART